MSWDAVILKIQGPFRPVEEVADEDYLPLGSIESVTERIRAAFPGSEWSGPTWATWSLDEDTGVTIDLEGVESSNSIVVSVSGSGNPVPHLLALARANDWVVLDCSTTQFLNPDEGSSEGWEGYQSVMSRLPEPIADSVDQAPPQVAPQAPPEPPPQSPPRAKRKKKATKKAARQVAKKAASKKSRPMKKRPKLRKRAKVKKRAQAKKGVKAKSSRKKKKPRKKK